MNRPLCHLRRRRTTQAGLLLAISVSVLLLAVGCSEQPVEELRREHLFDIRVGPLAHQLNLFRVGTTPTADPTRLIVRDGLLYIANGPSGKIMRFSSYGDLVYLLYDPGRNPQPVGLEAAGVERSTRTAASYPFREVNWIAVDSSQNLYTVELLPENRWIDDPRAGLALNRVVLRFDRNGQLIGSIGQEGLGGSPFGYVHRLYVTRDDELVVVTRGRDRWQIFRYDADARLRSQVDLVANSIPANRDAATETVVLEELYLDPVQPYAYLFASVQSTVDPVVEAESNAGGRLPSDPVRSEVHVLDIANERWIGWFPVPSAGARTERLGRTDLEVYPPLYFPIGVTESGAIFFLRPERRGVSSLMLVGVDGRVIARRNIRVEEDLDLVSAAVSDEGVLVALLAGRGSASVVRWRSDRLLGTGAL